LVDDAIKIGKTKGSRALDFIVKTKGGWKGIEATSRTARKNIQTTKEGAIRDAGGSYVRHPKTKELIELSDETPRIARVD
jgi:hypothetical protein